MLRITRHGNDAHSSKQRRGYWFSPHRSRGLNQTTKDQVKSPSLLNPEEGGTLKFKLTQRLGHPPVAHARLFDLQGSWF